MIFLTVGTEFPFNRLLKAVDDHLERSLYTEEVYAQIGVSQYKPCNMEWIDFLDRDNFEKRIIDSSTVISHAGIGTIIDCLYYKKPLVVFPRLKEYGEIVNDHQLLTAKKFEAMRYIIVAYDIMDLPNCINKAKLFKPPNINSNLRKIISGIDSFINELRS
jgi:UDP-N-acetylglucosamine transferase subunit ALG13